MRILLVGEFSSLHKFLKDGLDEIGHSEIDFVSNGDGWKKIPGASKWLPDRKSKGVLDSFIFYYEYIQWGVSVGHYDIIQLIDPGIFPLALNVLLFRKLRSNAKCMSLLCAGGTYDQVKAYRRHELKYAVYDYDKTALERYNETTLRGRLWLSSEQYVVERVDIIIPSLSRYGYEGKDMYDIIPFPINLDGLEYRPNIPKRKLVFFHGINRELAKGTPFIREALNRLAERYPNDVEVIINKRMPYEEYVQVMRRANVILDQCCGNGYGINSCLSMAQGKVTMASIYPEYPPIHADSFPMIQITPDAEQIYSQLVLVLENRNKIEQWGYESRKYVETYHECKMIAQKYIDAWKSTGKV